MDTPPLTDQQQRFVDEYLVDLNATQAALRAGYSPDNARAQASRLLTKANVATAIGAALAARAKRTHVRADAILKELARLGFADIGEAFDTDGNLLELKAIPKRTRRAIASYEIETSDKGVKRRIRFWDKPKALELLGKHLKLFTDKVELSGTVTLEQLVEQSLKAPALDEPLAPADNSGEGE